MQSVALSVHTKILVALAVVFVTLMIATTWHMAVTERAMAQSLAEQRAQDTARSFFDGVNTMMLTGTTAQRELLRQKVLGRNDISAARIVRGSAVNQAFGPGNPEQAARDDLDRRALAGEPIVQVGADAAGRSVTVLTPIVATADFRGTNCLGCHAVAEGTILGAVRVTYSLAALDQQIGRNILISGAINVLMLVVGTVAITWLLGRIVVRPLRTMRATMQAIEQDADVSRRLAVTGNDEIGALAAAVNTVLERFSGSLHEVFHTTRRLKEVAGQIAAVSTQTAAAADQQRAETDAVATAVTELESTAVQVREGANSAARVSIEADRAATDGARTTREAIDGIHVLVGEIDRAADAVENLDRRSQGVGGVLDVIRTIAEQTNLLALNAAIEAARAGEKGRGFAVVADEVRFLAKRSHESTQEIEKIVEQLQIGARDAVEVMVGARHSAEQRRTQVETADSGLNLIAERVAQIRDLNAQMAAAAAEQSAVTQDVGRNVVNISELAQRTAVDAEQATAVSDLLLQLSDRLEELVQQFRFSP
jgi:methyl-accepting chemotaxis protein